jgi:hypothetical protein
MVTMDSSANDLFTCPICFDAYRWGSVEQFEYDDVNGQFIPASTTAHASTEASLYVKCPNPSGDSNTHFLPARLAEYGTPVVIALVGVALSGKTHLLAAQVHQMMSGMLDEHGIDVEPLDILSYRDYVERKLIPFSRGERLPAESTGNLWCTTWLSCSHFLMAVSGLSHFMIRRGRILRAWTL